LVSSHGSDVGADARSIRQETRPSVRPSLASYAGSRHRRCCMFFNYKSDGGERKQARRRILLLNKALNNINGSIIQSRLSRARVRALYTHFFNPLAAICVELSCGGLNKLRVCK
jgi:hypothetical protein